MENVKYCPACNSENDLFAKTCFACREILVIDDEKINALSDEAFLRSVKMWINLYINLLPEKNPLGRLTKLLWNTAKPGENIANTVGQTKNFMDIEKVKYFHQEVKDILDDCMTRLLLRGNASPGLLLMHTELKEKIVSSERNEKNKSLIVIGIGALLFFILIKILNSYIDFLWWMF